MLNKVKTIIAVDPGSTNAGIAYFEDEVLIDSEQLKFKAKDSFYNRLRSLKSSVERFFSNYGAMDYIALETQFIGRNPQAGLKIGQARGIILALAFDYDVKIIDISPQETRSHYGVKGNAKKEAYQQIVKLEVQSNKILGEDEADAIAIGSTAISKIKNARLLQLK